MPGSCPPGLRLRGPAEGPPSWAGWKAGGGTAWVVWDQILGLTLGRADPEATSLLGSLGAGLLPPPSLPSSQALPRSRPHPQNSSPWGTGFSSNTCVPSVLVL